MKKSKKQKGKDAAKHKLEQKKARDQKKQTKGGRKAR